MNEIVAHLEELFPYSTQDIAARLHVSDARIRQIAVNLEAQTDECIKLGGQWKFTDSAHITIKTVYLR